MFFLKDATANNACITLYASERTNIGFKHSPIQKARVTEIHQPNSAALSPAFEHCILA